MAKETAKINDILLDKYGLGNDMLRSPLMYHQEFPSVELINNYQFNSNNLSG